MPHSESPVVTDLVNGNNSILLLKGKASPNLSSSDLPIILNHDKLAPTRPPLPPNAPSKFLKSKLPVKKPSLFNQQTIASLSLSTNTRPEIKSNNYRCQLEKDYLKPLEIALKLPISRSTTPTDLETSHLLSLSRNSSFRSLDGTNRSFSPLSVISNTSGLSSLSRSQSLNSPKRSVTPRRIFPQSYSPDTSINLDELNSLEQSPTVFDGKLSFVLGCKKQRVRQEFRPLPAHAADIDTASRYLSEKIQNFLKRTDHVAEEWKACCKSSSRHFDDVVSEIEDKRNVENGAADGNMRLGRSKSVTNIMIKGYQMTKNMPPTVRSNSVCRDTSTQQITEKLNGINEQNGNDDEDDDTIVEDFDEVKILVHVCY